VVPFKHEMDDGYDTVEWAAALPHSNGKVGMFSGSYVGATQMLAAIGHPPHLAGICPVVTASNYHENWTYQGGAFEQWFNESWTSASRRTRQPRHQQANTTRGGQHRSAAESVSPSSISSPADGARADPHARALLSRLAGASQYDSYWKQWSIEENYQNIQVPALTIAAWYDIFQGGSLRNYMGIKAHGGSEARATGNSPDRAIGGHSGWTARSALSILARMLL
jgi:putative CocE/NonD family hydrolase